MREKKNHILPVLIALSAFLCSMLGRYWDVQYYHDTSYTLSNPPVAAAMRGFHDRLLIADYSGFRAGYAVSNLSSVPAAAMTDAPLSDITSAFSASSVMQRSADAPDLMPVSDIRSFTTATDAYFDDACFIGDSRTVGISKYSGIENATFLCKTSLTIYDYNKQKITYENRKTSVHDVLAQRQFAKIYLMVGINECGTGTPESFLEHYRDVVEDIRSLQPDALIFIQGNLLVTKSKSAESSSITNENIAARNSIIATLANQKDIFYIDINESSLCEDGALVPDYTWDQVHIKAQYYPVWKDFLLQHAIMLS